MGDRLDLQTLLETITNSENIYFQPPESKKLVYPCIVYTRSSGLTTFANDVPYKHHIRYNVTVIDKDPDSTIPAKVADLPMCAFGRHFTVDNLNHDVYNLFY